MIALTFAQMRRSVGRLAAAGLAIALGAAFVAATLLASGLITRTVHDALTSSLAGTDLLVVGDELDDDALATVRTAPGVEVAEGRATGSLELVTGARTAYVSTNTATSDPRLATYELVAGTAPADGEIAVRASVADRLGVEVGDTVTANVWAWEPTPGATDADSGDWRVAPERLRLSGTIATAGGALLAAGDDALLSRADAERFHELGARPGAEELRFDHIAVVVQPGRSITEVRSAVADLIGEDGATVRTREEHAELLADRIVGETNVLTGLVLAFAVIALIVSSLVIANTLSVLVAQRTRTLALLRCVGATTKQLRRSVTLEAILLGLVSSAAGIAAGVGLVQVALLVAGRVVPDVPLPATVSLTPAIVLVPMIAGTAAALLAALTPARAASRIAPLAAMRPAETPSVGSRSSRRRFVLSVLLTVSGIAALAAGAMLGRQDADATLGLAVGVLGGTLSIVGVLVGAVFWIPRLIGAAGAVLGRLGGPATKLASANSVRNPRRTAATSSALLIGVTLVAMMSTGAATARTSFDQELDRAFPVDVAVASVDRGEDGVPSGLERPSIDAAVQAAGVEAVAELQRIDVIVTGGAEDLTVPVLAVAPTTADQLVRDARLLAGFDADTVIVPAALAGSIGLSDGQNVTIAPATAGEQADGGASVQLTARVTELADATMLVPATVGDQLAPGAATTDLWVRVADDHDPAATVDELRELFVEQPVDIAGAAAERAEFESIIGTLLAIVVGLLGVAVVIAMIGVANTLSLSVLERRRESATLRAIGLTRRQLRHTLAIEGMLIAGSGAIFGSALGTVYGWVGASTVLGSLADGVPFVVAWRDLAIVFVVAVLAGFAASVLPGRRAARTSPVAALAAE